jgi:hypothetical protein
VFVSDLWFSFLVFPFSYSLLNKILYSVLFCLLQQCAAEVALLIGMMYQMMRVLYDELCDYLALSIHPLQ